MGPPSAEMTVTVTVTGRSVTVKPRDTPLREGISMPPVDKPDADPPPQFVFFPVDACGALPLTRPTSCFHSRGIRGVLRFLAAFSGACADSAKLSLVS